MKRQELCLVVVLALACSATFGSGAAQAQGQPDLVVTQIGCDPHYNSTLTFTVQNRGNAPLPKSWHALAGAYLDGVQKGTINLGTPTSGSLTPAGGSAYYMVAIEILAPVAAKVVADTGNDISESNETNNTLTVKLAPCGQQKQPDLTVRIQGPGSASPGQNIGPLTSLTVTNAGDADAQGTVPGGSGYMVDVVLSTDGVLPVAAAATSPVFAEDMLLTGGRVSQTTPLAPGASHTYPLGGGAGVRLPKSITPGKYCLGAVVDPLKAVTEKREDNNTSCSPILIQ
jgi:subtilase family serine protease